MHGRRCARVPPGSYATPAPAFTNHEAAAWRKQHSRARQISQRGPDREVTVLSNLARQTVRLESAKCPGTGRRCAFTAGRAGRTFCRAGLLESFRRRAGAHEVAVAVGLVDTPDRRPVFAAPASAVRIRRLFAVVGVLPLPRDQ